MSPAPPAAPLVLPEGLPALGDVVAGKYRIDESIGEGGMGIVLGATHLELGRRVALKFLSPALTTGDAVGRFLREARAMAALQGEHVARVMDVGSLASGAPYIVMERLVGVDLERELARRGRFPIDEAVDCVLQACEAVAEAHAAGIVHRDLKPSNLFRATRPPGEPIVKVLDFGISKQVPTAPEGGGATTTGGGPIGSPRYMSPEQIRGKSVDRRTDVWALGVVLFELLAARSPLAADTFPALYAAITADPTLPLREARADAPAPLEAAIAACLEKDVTRRCPDVATLARAIAPFGPATGAARVARIEAFAAVAGRAGAAEERPPSSVSLAPTAPATPPPSARAAAGARPPGDGTMSPSSVTETGSARRPAGRARVGLLALTFLGGALTTWAVVHRSGSSDASASAAPLEAASRPAATSTSEPDHPARKADVEPAAADPSARADGSLASASSAIAPTHVPSAASASVAPPKPPAVPRSSRSRSPVHEQPVLATPDPLDERK